MQDSRTITPLVLFLALLLLFSGALTALTVATGFSQGPVMGLMWSVGVAAIIALKLSGRGLSELGWSWGPSKYHLIAFLLPLAYCLLGYGAATIFGLVDFPDAEKAEAIIQSQNLSFLPAPLALVTVLALLATVGMIQSMTSALGEEIGWRGFLAPRLTAMSGFLIGTLLTGALWAAWHMPLMLLSKYNGGGDVRFELISFVTAVLAMSGPMTWLRLTPEVCGLAPSCTLRTTSSFKGFSTALPREALARSRLWASLASCLQVPLFWRPCRSGSRAYDLRFHPTRPTRAKKADQTSIRQCPLL